LSILFILLAAGLLNHYSSTLKSQKWYKILFSAAEESQKNKFSATIGPITSPLKIVEQAILIPEKIATIDESPLSSNKNQVLPVEALEPPKTLVNHTPDGSQLDVKLAAIDKKKPLKPEKTIEKHPVQFKDNHQWVLQKSAQNYTLQLMVTPNKSALLKMLTQHSHLKGGLKYVTVTSKNKVQYLLLSGNFSTTAAAQKRVQTLPNKFKAAWPKKFSALQTELKKSR
jgi:septal ring-binding cell division protein DamX